MKALFHSRAATCSALLAAALSLLAGAPARGARLVVQVSGVAQARGHVRVELCTRTTFLTYGCPYFGIAPAAVGETSVEIDAPPGRYAAQAFLDDTDSGRVHQNLLGIPREPVGFSNDAPIRLRGPRFDEASFVIGPGPLRIHLRLRKVLRP